MAEKIHALEENKIWIVEDLPPGKNPINCKWVYRIKYNVDESIQRYKTRFLIHGNHQVQEFYYNETFASIAKMIIVRIFLLIAMAKGRNYFKWMLTMPSDMEIWVKRYLCACLLDFAPVTPIKLVDSRSHYMSFVKPHKNGSPSYPAC